MSSTNTSWSNESNTKADSTIASTVSDVNIAATSKLYLDGGGNTYLTESSADLIDVFSGGAKLLSIASNTLVINEDSADIDFRVESNGNANMLFVDGGNDKVGIGTTSPEALLHLSAGNVTEVADTNTNLAISDGGASYIEFLADDGESEQQGVIWSDGTTQMGGIQYKHQTDDLILRAGGANVFYIDGTNARVGINDQPSSAKLYIKADTDAERGLYITDADAACDSSNIMVTLDFSGDSDVNGATYILFEDSGGEVGQISASGSTTSFNTSSDYRLKEDFKDIVDATGTINQLKLYEFAWKRNTEKRGMGVIAHEAQEIVPTAITGTKDAMTTKEYRDENGEDQTKEVVKPQQVDYSKFVPLLLKSIQELSAKVEALENA